MSRAFAYFALSSLLSQNTMRNSSLFHVFILQYDINQNKGKSNYRSPFNFPSVFSNRKKQKPNTHNCEAQQKLIIDNFMQQLPNIKALYQRKYLQQSPGLVFSDLKSHHSTYFSKTQRLCDRISGKEQPTRKLSCVKVIKQAQTTYVIDNYEEKGHSLGRKPLSFYQNNMNRLGSAHSSQKIASKKEMLKQMLKISQQDLLELQSNIGGEKSLMGLMNRFFIKRHDNNRINRQSKDHHQFKPMRNILKRYREDTEKAKTQRAARVCQPLHPSNQAKSPKKLKERDLTPWIVDPQFN